ncbi:MAG: putative DNA-binding domain-containing protein [Marinilabilia sp.]
MLLNNTTHKAQSALAGFCRTGETPDINGVRLDNLPHYRRLVRNIFNDTLTTAYPITHELLTHEEWKDLVNAFMREYSPSNPQVWQMPRELWEYVTTTEHPLLLKHPFLAELLWFEWLEVELYMMKDLKTSVNLNGKIEHDKLVINPEHTLQHFNWPVFLKPPNQIKNEDQGHYFLIIYRHPESSRVQFMGLSPHIARLLEMLAERSATLSDLIIDLSIEMKMVINEHHLHFYR